MYAILKTTSPIDTHPPRIVEIIIPGIGIGDLADHAEATRHGRPARLSCGGDPVPFHPSVLPHRHALVGEIHFDELTG